MKMHNAIATLGSLFLAASAASASVVTYDASGNAIPAAPDFGRADADSLTSIFGYNAPQSIASGVYSTGPTSQSKYTFWYTASQTLDHTKTVEISAHLKLDSEFSANTSDRAGLALSLTDDQNNYQEMYINAGEVFLNKAGRVRDVAFSLDATQWHDYTLRVQNGIVTVDVDGITRLTGSMFSTAGGGFLPTLPNWAVVGDITGSAYSSYEMTSFQVAVVPEPSALAILAITPLLTRKRRI